MTALDPLVIGWIAVWAIYGVARGTIEQVLSLGGLVVGALAGSRLAPMLLPGGGASPWVPLVALLGAVVGALVVQGAVLRATLPLRRLIATTPLRRVDQGGGLLLGAAVGLALAWLGAAVALYAPGDRVAAVREQVQRSAVLRAALGAVPPDRLLGALARLDPFPLVPLPPAALPPPDESVLRLPAARAARASVVQVRGRACGLAKQGSGWVAGDDLVVTNAHVIAGQEGTRVVAPGSGALAARPVRVDAANDVAVLRVDGLEAPALAVGRAPASGQAVVLLGHPEGGALQAEAATASGPRAVLAPDAYGRLRGPRSVVATRGSLGPGSSGGPVIGPDGTVVAMIFGGAPGGDSGAAVPPGPIRRALEGPLAATGSGPCT